MTYTQVFAMNDKKYNIGAVSRITGLSSHAIRAWEKRYGVVNPQRSASSNRREYSQKDLELLVLLKRATSKGFNIGNIVKLGTEELRSMLDSDITASGENAGDTVNDQDSAVSAAVSESLNAIMNYDSEKLEHLLSGAFVQFGRINTIEKLIAPLAKTIGEHWSSGKIRIAQEHLASEIIRSSLLKVISQSHEYTNSPAMVVATPAGQMHDIGALIAGSIAATEGWRIIFLGPNLPAEEIAGAINRTGARVVILSIVYPGDDIKLNEELLTLKRFLEKGILILAGGNAAGSYLNTLRSIDAEYLKDIGEFKSRLKSLRNVPS